MKLWIKILLLAAGLNYSCVDPISFETDSEGGQLVVFGNFTQLDQPHTINISQSSEFGLPAIPVSGGCIIIMDNLGNSAYYEELETGTYQLAANEIAGVPGRLYHIEVELADGKTYFSKPQVMPEPILIDDVYFEIGPRQVLSGSGNLVEQTLIDIYIDTPLHRDPGNSTHFRWTMDEVYSFVDRSCHPMDGSEQCYFLVDPIYNSEVLIFENEDNGQDNVERFRVRSRQLVPYDEFTARHYFIVHQLTISDEELEYWKKIDAVANQSGSLFDVQPAPVVGNIYQEGNEQGGVLGYFGVNGQSTLRTFTTPFDIRPNHPVFSCMDQIFFADHQPECCFCSTKEAIKIERPAYWDED